MATEPLQPPAADVSRRFRLRHATRVEHERLDTLITAAGFLTAMPRYLAYLAATLNAREAIERALDAADVVEVYADWPRRRLAMDLRQDLRDLDYAAATPSGPSGFAVSGRAEILGALYVLEGSSLGARLLQKAVAPLGVDATFGARHMAIQTNDSSAWRRFIDLLDTSDLDAPGEAECARTAARAFGRFEKAYQDALSAA